MRSRRSESRRNGVNHIRSTRFEDHSPDGSATVCLVLVADSFLGRHCLTLGLVDCRNARCAFLEIFGSDSGDVCTTTSNVRDVQPFCLIQTLVRLSARNPTISVRALEDSPVVGVFPQGTSCAWVRPSEKCESITFLPSNSLHAWANGYPL